ncbi:MAG: glycoside hydrolase family 43 protein [Prolixibacteraceae bacterium]|jgi:hypothetical protein|nr:glycoside hydrolase family 43 protein [Prolixibacteraceae bacterium]
MNTKVILIATTIFLFAGISKMFGQMQSRYLVEDMYTADPSVHIFDGKIFVYPSHDIHTEGVDGAMGGHYNMKDYHVFSMENINGKVKDHGVVLSLDDIPWAGRQLWAPDCAEKDGKYYFYFPAKDKNDIFRIGVATGDSPEGPFVPQPAPIIRSYSIDPAVFKDDDGKYYMYFGGLRGGQLQRYRNNKALECGEEPSGDKDALYPKIAAMSDDMLQFAEEPHDVVILDKQGRPFKGSDHQHRFFEGVWLHKYQGKYYLSYSTGNTHNLCYATGDSPYGPFTYQGILMSPVHGWTTHNSIAEIDGKWYIFYHDTKQSGKNYLRNIKVREFEYNEDGSIDTIDGMD